MSKKKRKMKRIWITDFDFTVKRDARKIINEITPRENLRKREKRLSL